MTRRIVNRRGRRVDEMTSGSVAAVNCGLGGGDPEASIYATVRPREQKRADEADSDGDGADHAVIRR